MPDRVTPEQAIERLRERGVWIEKFAGPIPDFDSWDALLDIAEAAQEVALAFTAESEDWNDGEFALWKKDDLVSAIANLRIVVGRLAAPGDADE